MIADIVNPLVKQNEERQRMIADIVNPLVKQNEERQRMIADIVKPSTSMHQFLSGDKENRDEHPTALPSSQKSNHKEDEEEGKTESDCN